MEVTEKKQNSTSIFKISGRLDSNTSPQFEKQLLETIANGQKQIIIDFESLDYIASAGLRVLLKATKELKRSDGKIVLCSMRDYIKEVFDIAGFSTILPIVPTLDDALKAF
ncbi:MAG: STAS domain-containing protein [Deltaproteobacteria bacterium]|nr:STAS domain-containing protein [Deltaproteobacteria bacterium]MBW2072594.1 STAS domain-containing protein [Deltaproteobacteria bacterium]